MIQVQVTYTFADNEKRDAYLAELAENNILAQTLAEKGNICYSYNYPVGKDGEIFLLEQWEDQPSVDVHGTQPHFLLMQEIKKKYVLKTEIKKYSADVM